MKKFMAVYTGNPQAREKYEKENPDPKKREAREKEGMQAWMKCTVVEAESQEAAAKMFLNHSHFTIFPGDGVEIMECLPMPKMP